MNKLIAASAASLVALAAPVPATADSELPTTYIVSREQRVMPEGIAVTSDGTMYVTSVGTGAVYRGNTRQGTMRQFLPAGSDGRIQAAGVHVDRRGRVFIAAYRTRALFVYTPEGKLVAKRVAPDEGAALNDLVITDDAVYVTDSGTGIIWRAALSGSWIGELTAWLTPADFPFAPGFLNGIVATDDGRIALVSDGGEGVPGEGHLWRVDLRLRKATEVAEIGGRVGAADGLLREGNRLYAVIDATEPDGSVTYTTNLAVLNRDLTTATVVRRSDKATRVQSPTTIARDPHGRLLWVFSQFGNPTPTPPFTVEVVRGLR